MILIIVLLKIEICLLTPLLEKALSQLNWDMDRWIKSYSHLDSARQLVHMKVDRKFLSKIFHVLFDDDS